MNVEDRLDRAKRAKHMQALLDAEPLDVGDPVALLKRINEQHELIRFLAESLAHQGQMILDLRKQQVVHAGAVESLANLMGAEPDTGPLIGIKKQKLVGIN